MTFLRTLANALLSALFFAVLLAVLVVDLNVNLTVTPRILVVLSGWMAVTYGILAAALTTLIALAFRFLTGGRKTGGFISPSFLMLATSLQTLVALIIIRENTAYFAAFFSPAAQAHLRVQIIALFTAAVAGLVAYFEYRHHKPHRAIWIGYFALLAAVLGLTIYERMTIDVTRQARRTGFYSPTETERRVTLIGIDGLSFDFIQPLAAEGLLPNFAALMENGAWGRIEGFTPNDPFVLRRSLLTGKTPGHHRQISDVRYSLPGLARRLEVVPRFILFRQMTKLGILSIGPNPAPGLAKDLWRITVDAGLEVLDASAAARPAGAASEEKAAPKPDSPFQVIFRDFESETSRLFDPARRVLRADDEAADRCFREKTALQPRLTVMFLEGLSPVQSLFYKYSVPEAFGEIRQEDILRYGPVIRKAYQLYDRILGRAMAALKEDELLAVVSTHGVEPLPYWKRIVEWALGNPDVSAYHEQAPDGAVFFFGGDIAKGSALDAIKIVDVLPTLLYYLRLPVGRDMDGIVRSRLFPRSFTEANPVFTITSYDDMELRPTRVSE
ncbi:MAG: alkaline phosphatase family protein [Acidobacteriota bacterium]|nr:alkaline phosphatase family protein [Acidobacteriota bacterium]